MSGFWRRYNSALEVTTATGWDGGEGQEGVWATKLSAAGSWAPVPTARLEQPEPGSTEPQL